MVKKANLKGHTLQSVQNILEEAKYTCSMGKPSIFKSKNNRHLVVRTRDVKIHIKVTPTDIQYSLDDPAWVFFAPIIIYSFIRTIFKIGSIYLLLLMVCAYILSKVINTKPLIKAADDLNRVILSAP